MKCSLGTGLGQRFEWTIVRVNIYFAQIIILFPLMKILYEEGQDSKTVYSFARIDFWSKYISFDLLKLLSCSNANLKKKKKEYLYISHDINLNEMLSWDNEGFINLNGFFLHA